MRSSSLLLLALASCGPDSFTMGDSGKDPEGSSPLDAQGSETVQNDGGLDVLDAGSDSSTCTPFATSVNCFNYFVTNSPAHYCRMYFKDATAVMSDPGDTPQACQCRETFTCDCFAANSSKLCGFDAGPAKCHAGEAGPWVECSWP